MKTRVTETIFTSEKWVVPMSQVQHIEKEYDKGGKLYQIAVVTDKTRWSFQYNVWENPVTITDSEVAQAFLNAYCSYVAERDGCNESPVYIK